MLIHWQDSDVQLEKIRLAVNQYLAILQKHDILLSSFCYVILPVDGVIKSQYCILQTLPRKKIASFLCYALCSSDLRYGNYIHFLLLRYSFIRKVQISMKHSVCNNYLLIISIMSKNDINHDLEKCQNFFLSLHFFS